METEEQQAEKDEYLVAQVNRGDQAAFARLYDRYGSLVHAIAMRILHDSSAAEDLVHDVFIQFWRRSISFDPARGKLPAWLTVITRNKAVDLLRKRPVEVEVDERSSPIEPTVQASAYHTADFEKARKLMDGLPSDQRRALELAFFEGHTHSEIADKLGEPLGTVKSRIRMGLITLKKALAA